ncbi:MAG: hypothetical protein ABIZ80_06045, partial [Bryobacteraceae bacterium]
AADDLRLYALVQFYPMLAVPLMLLLFPPRYTGVAGVWGMIGFYVLAKVLELTDPQIWRSAFPLSGHSWKHAVGAVAMLCYVRMIDTRRLVGSRELLPLDALPSRDDRRGDAVSQHVNARAHRVD